MVVGPMMTFVRILIYSVVFVSRNGERKFQLEKKTPPFSMEMDMRDHHYIAIYKKKKRERERVKEG